MNEDPHTHLKSFVDVCNSFMIPRVSPKAVCLTLLLSSLRDETRQRLTHLSLAESSPGSRWLESLAKVFPLNSECKAEEGNSNL